jgi:hypothetical protein
MLKIETDSGAVVMFPTPAFPAAFTRTDARVVLWETLVAIDAPKVTLPKAGGGPIVIKTAAGTATITVDDAALEAHIVELLRRELLR